MKPFIVAALFFVPLAACGADGTEDDSLYKARSSLSRRLNGAKLVATAAVSGADADKIEIRWSLDYEGPRPPLVILTPSLSLATDGQTEVIVYAQPKGGKPHEMRLRAPIQPDKFWVPKDWFLTVEKGKTAQGLIEVRVAEVKEFFVKNWPERFKEGPPPQVRIQLAHNPTERGQAHGLDAWTGELCSAVVLIELKTW